MRLIILFLLLGLFFTGCAHDTPYADREYGMATRDAFDRQIAYKDSPFADKPDDGIDGLYVERTMEMYDSSFGTGFTQESIDVLSSGN